MRLFFGNVLHILSLLGWREAAEKPPVSDMQLIYFQKEEISLR